MAYFSKYRFLLLSYLAGIFLILISCVNSPEKNVINGDQTLEAALLKTEDKGETIDEVDIPIAINLAHTENEDMRNLVDAEYEIMRETYAGIFIDTNSKYLKKYISGTRFKADHVSCLSAYEKSENVEYLTMNLDVVNNTNEQLSINELNVEVDESKPDSLPIVYICTTETRSNSLLLLNNSWFDWKGCTFSYSLLRRGETFNGRYKKRRYIPYFDDRVVIDLLPEMEKMGYDFNSLVNYVRDMNNRENRKNGVDSEDNPLHCDEEDNYLCFWSGMNSDDWPYLAERISPFGVKCSDGSYKGIALLYGSLKFDNTDFKVDFVAEISLYTAGEFGALSYENDKFDVNLKSLGEDYTLRYPYTTVIEPGGSEMIKLSVKAGKSSSHRFYINIKNENGLKVRSKDIHFHYYYPKN